MAFESPCCREDAIYTAQIYANALGSGMTTVYAGTSADQIADLATITVNEIKRAAADMSTAEVDRARAQMKAGLLMGLESPSNRAERLARLVQIWDRVPALTETVALIDSVTVEDVRVFSEHMATQAPMALALYGPIDAAPTRRHCRSSAPSDASEQAETADRNGAHDAAPAYAFRLS